MESRGKKSFQLKLESEIVQFAWLIPWLVGVFIFKASASGGGYRSVLHQASDCGSAVSTTNQSSRSSSSLETAVFYRTGVALELHWNTRVFHFPHILLDDSTDNLLCEVETYFTIDGLQLSGAKSRTEMKRNMQTKSFRCRPILFII